MSELHALRHIVDTIAAGTTGSFFSWMNIVLVAATVLVFFMGMTMFRFAREEA